MDRDDYDDLGLTQQATSFEIKTAFHTLALQYHPDKTGDGDTSAFRCVREAFEKLTEATFKREYDHNYANMRMRFDTDSGPKKTRTEAYKTEAARKARDDERATYEAYEEMLRRSPPPKQPARRTGQSGTDYYLGRAYQAWAKRDEAYRKNHPSYDQADTFNLASATYTSKAHGLTVQMTSHPCTTERCTLKADEWRTQTAGTDVCVFCLKTCENGSRCPGCQALACKTCEAQIVALEQSSTFHGLSSKGQYRSSGG